MDDFCRKLSIYLGVRIQIYLSALWCTEVIWTKKKERKKNWKTQDRYIRGNLEGQVLASESRCNLRGEREEINEHHPGPSKEYTNTQICKYTNTQMHKCTNTPSNTQIWDKYSLRGERGYYKWAASRSDRGGNSNVLYITGLRDKLQNWRKRFSLQNWTNIILKLGSTDLQLYIVAFLSHLPGRWMSTHLTFFCFFCLLFLLLWICKVYGWTWFSSVCISAWMFRCGAPEVM